MIRNELSRKHDSNAIAYEDNHYTPIKNNNVPQVNKKQVVNSVLPMTSCACTYVTMIRSPKQKKNADQANDRYNYSYWCTCICIRLQSLSKKKTRQKMKWVKMLISSYNTSRNQS